jgi:hypothetical protein
MQGRGRQRSAQLVKQRPTARRHAARSISHPTPHLPRHPHLTFREREGPTVHWQYCTPHRWTLDCSLISKRLPVAPNRPGHKPSTGSSIHPYPCDRAASGVRLDLATRQASIRASQPSPIHWAPEPFHCPYPRISPHIHAHPPAAESVRRGRDSALQSGIERLRAARCPSLHTREVAGSKPAAPMSRHPLMRCF